MRLDGLVGLLEQVAHERLVRLLAVPRAALAQDPHDLREGASAPGAIGACTCGTYNDVR